MTFSIVGTGNIAWYFSKKIAASGHQCKGVFGRNEAAVKELADALLAPVYGSVSEIHDGISDVCFIAVKDAAIPEVAAQLHFTQTVLVHMAGALPLSVLAAAAKDYGLLWPVYSISRQQLPAGRNIPVAWEASTDRARRFVKEMGHAITDELFEATGEQRSWLHLCAVMSNNFINHLLAVNEMLCNQHDISANVLRPLIDQTFEKARNGSPLAAQTGPAIRNDSGTIDQHMAMLADVSEIANMYLTITNSIKKLHNKS
ncbi:MAG: DUF2520 domain-containing protein [Chitinophagia bacterium]|nr:DUF2520 domain-containing protein [Chitinophagia bacterium]